MSRLDRDKARHVLWDYLRRDSEVRDDDDFFDRLDACVLPDPRVAAALALHQREMTIGGDLGDFCARDGEEWPCATARALGAAS